MSNEDWSGTKNKTVVQEMHVYPRSRGKILRHIGEALEEAVELLVAHDLDDIHAFKRKRDRQGKFDDRPRDGCRVAASLGAVRGARYIADTN